MADWARALSEGLAQGFKAGSGLIDASMKEDAEKRAADRKLSDAERLIAIQEAMNVRADERREQLRVSGRESDFKFDTNPDNVGAKAQAKVSELETIKPVEARLDREAESAKNNDPQYIAGVRKKAQAMHIDSVASIAAANLSQFQLRQAQEFADLQKDYMTAKSSGDVVRTKELESKIEAKNFTGKAKDVQAYLSTATQLLKTAEKSDDPAEQADMKQKAALFFKMAGVSNTDTQQADPLGIRPKVTAKKDAAPSVQSKPPAKGLIDSTPPQIEDKRIDVANDPVLMQLNTQLAAIDKTDARNVDAIIKLGKAKNDRIEQLQQQYGRLSVLKYQ